MASSVQVQHLSSDAEVTSLVCGSETCGLLAGDTRGRLHFYKPQPFSHWLSFVSHLTFFDRDSSGAESEHVAAVQFVSEYQRAFTCLSANEKTIKLWSVGQQDGKHRLRLSFPSVHDFHIHSLSVHPTRDQFLACDDLSLTLWHFDHPATSFSLANLKPQRIEDLQEVLLFAAFHPLHPSLVVYSSTAGSVRIADLRLRAQAFPPALELRSHKSGTHLDLLASVSGLAFSSNEHVLFAREIRSVATWDCRYPTEPIGSTLILQNERRLLARGDTPKFQIAGVGESGWVTGGMDGNLVISREFNQTEEVDLSLGQAYVPFVVSDRRSSQLFVAGKGQIVALCEDIRNALST